MTCQMFHRTSIERRNRERESKTERERNKKRERKLKKERERRTCNITYKENGTSLLVKRLRSWNLWEGFFRNWLAEVKTWKSQEQVHSERHTHCSPAARKKELRFSSNVYQPGTYGKDFWESIIRIARRVNPNSMTPQKPFQETCSHRYTILPNEVGVREFLLDIKTYGNICIAFSTSLH